MSYGVVRNNIVVPGNGVPVDAMYSNPAVPAEAGRGLGPLDVTRIPIVIATPKGPGSGGAWGPWSAYVTSKLQQGGHAVRLNKSAISMTDPINFDVWIRRPFSRFDCGPFMDGPIRPARTGGSRIQAGASYRSGHYNVHVPGGEPPYYYPGEDAFDNHNYVDVVHNLHIPTLNGVLQCVVELFPACSRIPPVEAGVYDPLHGYDPLGCAAYVSDKNINPGGVYGNGNAIRIMNVPGAFPH